MAYRIGIIWSIAYIRAVSIHLLIFFLLLNAAFLVGSSDITFLSSDDFSRAQNMNFTEAEAESAPIPVPLNNPEGKYAYYEGDMMIQESDETKVNSFCSTESC